MKMRFIAVAALLAAVTLMLPHASFGDEAPYEINAVISTTGSGAFLGKVEVQDFQAIESLTNRSGGIKGWPIKFVIADDQSDPKVTVQLVSQLIAKKVPVIIGPGISATCSAALPLVADGPVTYCLSPAIHPPPKSWMFSATVSTNDLTGASTRYARERGWTRVALISATDATGQDVSRQILLNLGEPENKAMQVVARESFNPADISVTAQMANIKAAAPQVLLTAATGSPLATLLHGMRDVGLDVPVFATGGNMTFVQMSQYAAFLPRELFFTGIRGIAAEPQAPRAIKQAQTAYFDALKSLGVKSDFGSDLGWDAPLLVVDALRRLGTGATAAQIHEYLEGLSGWPGICGVYDFRKIPQRGLGENSGLIYRWDAATNDFVAASKPGGYLK
jgi:branched-chain amino acid transport system substrate-binding protein